MIIVWTSTQYTALGNNNTFYTNGGGVTLSFAGSGWSTSTDSYIGVNLLIDGNTVATLNGFTNEAGSHKALVPGSVYTTLSAGQHTATVSPAGSTQIDVNDYFSLVVAETVELGA
jgi:hypothetical protein